MVISRTYHLPHSGCLRGTEAPCHIVTPAFVPVGTNTRQVTCSSRSQAHTSAKSMTHTHIHPQTHKQIHMNTYESIVSHNHHFDFCCLSTGLGGIWRSPFFANCCNKSFFFKQIVLQDHFLQIVVKGHFFLQTVKCQIGVPEHFLHKVILGHFFATPDLYF